MKLLLDMYKGVSKEQRDKVQLMAGEKKLRTEVDELRQTLKKLQVFTLPKFPSNLLKQDIFRITRETIRGSWRRTRRWRRSSNWRSRNMSFRSRWLTINRRTVTGAVITCSTRWGLLWDRTKKKLCWMRWRSPVRHLKTCRYWNGDWIYALFLLCRVGE